MDKEAKLKKLLGSVRGRCNSEKFIEKGILCFLTLDELSQLWERDKASEMMWPSIDRICNDDDYRFDNCRFVEHWQNASKGNKTLREHENRLKERCPECRALMNIGNYGQFVCSDRLCSMPYKLARY